MEEGLHCSPQEILFLTYLISAVELCSTHFLPEKSANASDRATASHVVEARKIGGRDDEWGRKASAAIGPVSRRKALKLSAGSAAAAVAGLAAPAVIAAGKDKLLIGVPSSLSTPYGVADDTDHLNGTTLAVEEINAAGGVLGREIELFVPDVDKLISGKLPPSDRGLYR